MPTFSTAPRSLDEGSVRTSISVAIFLNFRFEEAIWISTAPNWCQAIDITYLIVGSGRLMVPLASKKLALSGLFSALAIENSSGGHP
jgi:hypothetical protein